MHALPTLYAGSGQCDLPLSEQAAARLAAAWLGEDALQRRALFEAAIASDPALAVWVAMQAAGELAEIPTLAELADWLDVHSLARFKTAADTSQQQPAPSSTSLADSLAKMAGVSLLVARLASKLAGAAALDAEQAHLLGLVHQGPQWLNFASAEPSTGGSDVPLPIWLRVQLDQPGRPPAHPPSTAGDCVALAVALVQAEDPAQFQAHGLNASEWIGQEATAAAAWSTPGPWAAALPTLAARLARLQQLETDFARTLEQEKLDALKELAYGAGHEINNPLANISARAQTLLAGEHDPDRRRLLAAINTQAFRAHEMIADMMLFARPPAAQLRTIDINEVLTKLAAELAPLAAAQQSEFIFRSPRQPVSADADATQLAVAVRAVCVNALEALVRGGRVELDLVAPAQSHLPTQIIITDNGPGIPEKVRGHIFDPFYSGREAGRGLGFGLSKCWRIVSMHGGTVEVAGGQSGGTVLTIALPNRNNR